MADLRWHSDFTSTSRSGWTADVSRYEHYGSAVGDDPGGERRQSTRGALRIEVPATNVAIGQIDELDEAPTQTTLTLPSKFATQGQSGPLGARIAATSPGRVDLYLSLVAGERLQPALVLSLLFMSHQLEQFAL
jgi:hypothetical protein